MWLTDFRVSKQCGRSIKKTDTLFRIYNLQLWAKFCSEPNQRAKLKELKTPNKKGIWVYDDRLHIFISVKDDRSDPNAV